MNSSTTTTHSLSASEPTWFVHRGGILPLTASRTMSEVLVTLGSAPDAWSDSCGVVQSRVRAGAPLWLEGAAVDALHVIRSGSFKCLKTNEDGYEHVLGFLGKGEILGLEALSEKRHPMSAVALEDAHVLTLPLHRLSDWRRRSPALDDALLRALSAQLLRACELAPMMAAVASEVRLARFLVWMSERMAARGESPYRFLLRMKRRDIASLLAVAHETVSRGLGLLADRGLIRVERREVQIVDMVGLKAATACTRRDVEHARDRAAGSATGLASTGCRTTDHALDLAADRLGLRRQVAGPHPA